MTDYHDDDRPTMAPGTLPEGWEGLRTRLRRMEVALRQLASDLDEIAFLAGLHPDSTTRRALPKGGADLGLLSPRELEILRYLLDGKRVTTIARTLFISPHTVRNHLKSIFRKLDVQSQAELLEQFGSLRSTTDGTLIEAPDTVFRQLAEEAPDGILVLDVDKDEVLFCNPTASRLLGHPVEKILERPLAGFLLPKRQGDLQTAVTNWVAEGGARVDGARIKDRRGNELPVLLTVSVARRGLATLLQLTFRPERNESKKRS